MKIGFPTVSLTNADVTCRALTGCRVALGGLALLLAAGAIPAAAQFDPGGLATRLKNGMTIGQVILALGNRPTSTVETTCHLQQTGEPFTCRVWNYTTQFEELQIYFRYSDPRQEWLVYSWRL